MASRRLGTPMGGARERGAGLAEYAGLIVIAALILGALVATGLPAQVGSGVGTAVCRVLKGTDCGSGKDSHPQAGSRHTGQKNDGKKEGGGKKKGGGCGNPFCRGFNKAKHAASAGYNGAKHVVGGAAHAAKDQGTGLEKLVTTNPLKTGKAFGVQAWHGTPFGAGLDAYHSCSKGRVVGCVESSGCALEAAMCAVDDTVADEATKQDIKNGRYGDAIGRDAWNVGSLFIPTKVPGLSKLGAAAKGAEEVGTVAKAAGDAEKAADRAEKLADKGDLAGARRAADEAKRDADEATREARKKGCKIVGLPALGGRPAPLRFGRFAAAAMPAKDGAECPEARQARRKAERAQRAVKKKELKENLEEGRRVPADEAERIIESAGKSDDRLADIKRLTTKGGGPIDPAIGLKAVRDVTDLLDNGMISKDVYGSLLAHAGSSNLSVARGGVAEINEVARVAKSGDIKPGTKMCVNCRGSVIDFGDGKPVDLRGISEIDLAYKSGDGAFKVIETKSTAEALRDTLKKRPGQGNTLKRWRNQDRAHNKIEYKIDSDADVSALFKHIGNSTKTPLDQIRESGASLRIGKKLYTSEWLKFHKVSSAKDLE